MRKILTSRFIWKKYWKQKAYSFSIDIYGFEGVCSLKTPEISYQEAAIGHTQLSKNRSWGLDSGINFFRATLLEEISFYEFENV